MSVEEVEEKRARFEEYVEEHEACGSFAADFDAFRASHEALRLSRRAWRNLAKNTEADLAEAKSLLARLTSEEPCPDCGHGVTGACYGCMVKALESRLSLADKLAEALDDACGCPENPTCDYCVIRQAALTAYLESKGE